MNFATKDRFGLNLLLYRKVGQNSISIIKRHNCNLLFRNYSQSKLQEQRRNLTINGKNYGNARRSFNVTMVTMYVAEETYVEESIRTRWVAVGHFIFR